VPKQNHVFFRLVAPQQSNHVRTAVLKTKHLNSYLSARAYNDSYVCSPAILLLQYHLQHVPIYRSLPPIPAFHFVRSR
jgi:hypothetical protein